MCGIAGIIHIDPNQISRQRLKIMTDTLVHRGPDGEGHWISEDGKTGLGHRRLCIIDLSEAASQPMHYMDRYTIIFNGEIYNYVELKNDLVKKGYSFKTHSDTEVLLALYHAEKEDCLHLLDGMFAFAIYDNKERKVFCARDRFGEKPFFYMHKKNEYFLFASEIKALKAYSSDYSINNKMLYNYLALGYLNNKSDLSETFYTDIFQLPHSHYLNIDIEKIDLQIKEYWRINTNHIDYSTTAQKAAEKLNELFYTSVNLRLRSDVNVGSSLSGGIDSSSIVCVIDYLLKRNKSEHSFESSAFKQKTFSARFPGFKNDEGEFMQMVIDKTNVEPHFVYPSDKT
ncbi:MAG: asparagine synthase (glutamine-hydrolyzing), partial [Bacteroidota bacterium]|nr:asparagine synthase (glutamine-hydrolyzing) [Bacteroidota bacterium]